ncbi:MAG: hypothetical protein ABW067_16375, partial [Rhizobacter sp.]
MFERKSPVIVALALAGGLFAGSAHAGRVSWSVNINVPGPVYAEPAYYAPPPVYYAPPPPVYYAPPPPVYYRPRPVVVYPPAVVYRQGPAIVGGSWERHRHGDGRGRGEWRGGDRPGRDGRGHY